MGPPLSELLIGLTVRALEHLEPLHGKVDSNTMTFVHKIFSELQKWYTEWHGIHRTRYDEESVLVRLLEVDLLYAQLWTVCVALRGCQWDKVGFIPCYSLTAAVATRTAGARLPCQGRGHEVRPRVFER